MSKKPTMDVMGKIISDPAFRQTLFSHPDPKQLLQQHGVTDAKHLEGAAAFVKLLKTTGGTDEALNHLRTMNSTHQ